MVQIIRDGFLVPQNERPSLGRSKLVRRIISSSWFRGFGGSGGGLSAVGGSRGSLQSSGPQVRALQVRFSGIGSSTGSFSESLQVLSAVSAVSASRRSWVLRASVLAVSVVSWRPRSRWSSGSQGHFMLVVWCPRDSAVFQRTRWSRGHAGAWCGVCLGGCVVVSAVSGVSGSSREHFMSWWVWRPLVVSVE
jgi:hypothetical protein